jgi:hypothetical protein
MHGRESSYQEVATILGSVVDPGVLHRCQPRFRETNNAEEGLLSDLSNCRLVWIGLRDLESAVECMLLLFT